MGYILALYGRTWELRITGIKTICMHCGVEDESSLATNPTLAAGSPIFAFHRAYQKLLHSITHNQKGGLHLGGMPTSLRYAFDPTLLCQLLQRPLSLASVEHLPPIRR